MHRTDEEEVPQNTHGMNREEEEVDGANKHLAEFRTGEKEEVVVGPSPLRDGMPTMEVVVEDTQKPHHHHHPHFRSCCTWEAGLPDWFDWYGWGRGD